jgi:cell fate regulator YaaT (PSP1 superfamily)
VVVCFAADERQDVRDMARVIGRNLRQRVELRQLGRREVAQAMGGMGRCGRELCCSTFLKEPGGSSIRMAKAQGLALSPDKTHGLCDRPLCCLAYEGDFYVDQRQWLPRLGKRATTTGGVEGKVVALDVLNLSFTLLDGDRQRQVFPADEWEGNRGKDVPAAANAPAACPPVDECGTDVVLLPRSR